MVSVVVGVVLASLPLVAVSRSPPGRCCRGADGLGSGQALLGEPPGQLGSYGGLVVSGALVGAAVQDGVEKARIASSDAGEDIAPHILTVDMRDAVSVAPGEDGRIGAGKG